MTIRLLLVDDDVRLLHSIKRQLNDRYEIELATSGKEAIQVIQEGNPSDVVVCDMHLGGMDGVAVLEKIKKLAPNTLRILLTGRVDYKTPVDAINRAKVALFLNKPTNSIQLDKAIRETLAERDGSCSKNAGRTKSIAHDSIVVGSILAEDVLLKDGTLLLREGQAVSKSTRTRLVRYSQEGRIPNSVLVACQ